MPTETREWKNLNCIGKVVAMMIIKRSTILLAEEVDDIKCDGPECAQFDPNFRGCAFRK